MKPIFSPYFADISITPVCNYKCSFCSASADVSHEKRIKIISLDRIEKLFYELDTLGILRIGFEGGEPFLRDDIIDIFHLADKYHFNYFVNTNGSMINEEMAKRLGNTKISSVYLSIDGPNSKLHDYCRGTIGAFEKVLEANRYLQQENVNVRGIFTLTKLNADYILDTLELYRDIGISKAAIMLLATVGSASNELYVDFEKWTEILIALSEKKLSGELPVNLKIVPTGESKHSWELFLPLKTIGKTEYLDLWINNDTIETTSKDDYACTAGRDNLSIDGYGNVYGCSLMTSYKELSAGNILDDSLLNIWENSKIFNLFRKLKLKDVLGKCNSCDELYNCRAGCRVCAYGLTKKINGSDLRCPIAKGEKL